VDLVPLATAVAVGGRARPVAERGPRSRQVRGQPEHPGPEAVGPVAVEAQQPVVVADAGREASEWRAGVQLGEPVEQGGAAVVAAGCDQAGELGGARGDPDREAGSEREVRVDGRPVDGQGRRRAAGEL
jgi:hypothetical protein